MAGGGGAGLGKDLAAAVLAAAARTNFLLQGLDEHDMKKPFPYRVRLGGCSGEEYNVLLLIVRLFLLLHIIQEKVRPLRRRNPRRRKFASRELHATKHIGRRARRRRDRVKRLTPRSRRGEARHLCVRSTDGNGVRTMK